MCQLEKTGELGMFTSLHLATHGWNVNSDTPMESHLFLQDSLLEGLEIANWQLDAELVVLGACCSGQWPIGGRGMAELPGDDLFGLPAAFFAAGAKQALSSLWPVYSDTARAIVTAFHRFLIAGQSPELALQGAVVEYINSAGLRLRNSFYWAPFFLVVVGRPYRKQAGP
jgi:CHAT domain-containing protein